MKLDKKILFKNSFLIITIILVTLPFFTAFDDQLTGLLQKTPLYLFIARYFVPYEVQIVHVVLSLFHLPVGFHENLIYIKTTTLEVTWNCLGWQSMLFLLISIITGLQGTFSLESKLTAIVIGLLGTFWVNIFRICFTVVLGGYFPVLYTVIFHNYLATFMTMIWLFGFWWFVYSYVLETKTAGPLDKI